MCHFTYFENFWNINIISGGGNVMYMCLYQKSVFKEYRAEGV